MWLKDHTYCGQLLVITLTPGLLVVFFVIGGGSGKNWLSLLWTGDKFGHSSGRYSSRFSSSDNTEQVRDTELGGDNAGKLAGDNIELGGDNAGELGCENQAWKVIIGASSIGCS